MTRAGAAKAQHATKRLVHVDAMRGVAILLMTVDHAYDWWLSEAARATAAWRVVHFLGSLAARGEPRRSLGSRMLRRGAVLVAAGYLLNLVTYFEGDNVAGFGRWTYCRLGAFRGAGLGDGDLQSVVVSQATTSGPGCGLTDTPAEA